MKTRTIESLLRTLGYLILLLAFLWLAMGVGAQELNREARLQRWKLISMEMSDANEATRDWNEAVKRYKTLDDINQYELLDSVRRTQVAMAKAEAQLVALDEPFGYTVSAYTKEFRCKCGVLVITNDKGRTKCTSCELK